MVDNLFSKSKGPDDFESELDYYRYVAQRMQASNDDMLERLRQLQAAGGLSAEDQAFVDQEIPLYEEMQRIWKLRRYQLDQREE